MILFIGISAKVFTGLLRLDLIVIPITILVIFFLEELYIVSVIDLNIMGSIQIIKEMCKITISVDSTSLPLLMTI